DWETRRLWEAWLEVLGDREQKPYGKDLFQFVPEKKIQAALRQMRDPGWQVQMKRIERLRLGPVKRNPLLTRDYLEGGSGLDGIEKAINRLRGQILSEIFERRPQGILGGGKYCPHETTSRQQKKMGRPTKPPPPMTRQRKKRGNAVFLARKYSGGILPDNPSPAPEPLPEPWGPWSAWAPPSKAGCPW